MHVYTAIFADLTGSSLELHSFVKSNSSNSSSNAAKIEFIVKARWQLERKNSSDPILKDYIADKCNVDNAWRRVQ